VCTAQESTQPCELVDSFRLADTCPEYRVLSARDGCEGQGSSSGLRDIFKESQMIFSKDYVGYLARQTVKHLVAEKMIHTEKPVLVNERVAAAMIDELSLEDRINDEVRVILEAFQDDMRKTGASYPEMFKKVKNELARKYKAVL
jgi:hypothetical protein